VIHVAPRRRRLSGAPGSATELFERLLTLRVSRLQQAAIILLLAQLALARPANARRLFAALARAMANEGDASSIEDLWRELDALDEA
jgi:hypothetical protein